MRRFILVFLLTSSILYANINAIVSIVPQKMFVEAIGGEKIDVTVMVKPGSPPNTYEPKPSQMRDISNADIYFTIGVPFEKVWLERFKSQNRDMQIVHTAKGVKKLEMKSCSCADDEHHNHGKKDPHIWTTPKNVKIIAQNIYSSLIKQDRQNEEYFRANLDKFLQHADDTDKKIRAILGQQQRKFMVFHPAWGYFAKEYNLIQMPIEIEGKEPKPKELKQLIQQAKKEGISAIFTAPEFSEKTAKQIANELKIPVIKISPLNENWSENLINFARIISKN